MKTNWQTKKLVEICEYITKGTTPTSIGYKFLDKGINFIKIESITGAGEFLPDKFSYISGKCHESLKRSQLKENDILFSIAGALGRTAVVSKDILPANTNQALAIVRLKISNEFSREFILFALNSGFVLEQIKKAKGGVAQQNLSLAQIKDFEIPLPPLPEQLRIVKILDEVFDGAGKAKENAERNLENSRLLFESYLSEVFLNPKFTEKKLDKVCDVEYGYTEKAKNEGDFRFVRITDTDENGLLTQDKKMYIDNFSGADKYILSDGDLLMARTGASAGNVLFFEGDEKAVFASYLIRMKFKKEVSSKLYWYFSKSKMYWDQVKQLSAGSAQPQFNGGALKQIIFPLPESLPEQKAIVAKLDALSAETKKLEGIYRQKMADVDELKKSVLKSAFAGKM